MPDTKLKTPKATSLLKEDHHKAKTLFDEYEKLADGAWGEKLDIYNQVHELLTMHAAIEEEIFYPACEQSRDRDAEALIAEALEEHGIVKTLLEELTDLSRGDATFDAKMKVLGESVKHHAREEEEEIFPIFDKLPRDMRDEVSEQLRNRKEELESP